MVSNEEVLNELPNDTVRSALIEIIERNIPNKDYTINKEKGAAKGDNYIGIVHRLSITYRKNDQDDNSDVKKLGIFLKVPPDNLIRRQQFFAGPCFLRESLMYDEYLPLLGNFQKSKNIIPEENGFKEYARCLKCITKEFEEAIFMEDLSLKGYVMHSRFEDPSADLVKVIMRALGKLHALSFALKDQCPEKLTKYKELQEILIRDDELIKKYINSLDEIAYRALSNEGDVKYLEKIKALVKNKPLFEHMRELLDGSKAEPYAVVCHGDSWNNNMLFKFENGKPIDIKLIDWQLSRYASPVLDLVYYIFCCTSKPMRDEHYQDILNEYYSELVRFLTSLGSDPTVLFPRSAFDDQLKKFGLFAFVMGLMLIPTFTSKEDEIPDLDELSARMEAGDEEYTKQAMQNNMPATNSKIRDMIIDLINLGYIN